MTGRFAPTGKGGRPVPARTGAVNVEPLSGAMFKKHLFALAAPQHRAASGQLGGRKPPPRRLGETISAGLARKIACEAGIAPAVLGGASEVLDLGRSRRFHSRAQRIEATIEQCGSIEEGCDAA